MSDPSSIAGVQRVPSRRDGSFQCSRCRLDLRVATVEAVVALSFGCKRGAAARDVRSGTARWRRGAALHLNTIPACRGVGWLATIYFCPPASIAASTFCGDIGSSVSRRPVARSIALAMAAIGGQMLTSAAPLAP